MTSRMRCARFAVAAGIVAISACGWGSGRPARLVIGQGDTLIVNHRTTYAITSRTLNADGKELAGTAKPTYRMVSGDSIGLTPSGNVTCTRAGDATVEATAGTLTTTAVIRCRPVGTLRMAGPIEFLVGDTARRLDATVLGLDGKPVKLVAGSVTILDRAVAGAQGMRIAPRAPGGTVVTLTVGDETESVPVHVYEPVNALVHLQPAQEFVAVALSLRSGEYRQWELPAGTWMLTMAPSDDGRGELRMDVNGAACTREGDAPPRVTCQSRSGITVRVRHPVKAQAPERTGRLLVRRVAG